MSPSLPLLPPLCQVLYPFLLSITAFVVAEAGRGRRERARFLMSLVVHYMQYTVRGSSLFLSSEERKAAAKRRSRTECDIKLGTILYLATRAAASTNDTHTRVCQIKALAGCCSSSRVLPLMYIGRAPYHGDKERGGQLLGESFL